MKSGENQSFLEKFRRKYPDFVKLREITGPLIIGALSDANMSTASYSSRIKSEESFSEKIERKGYNDPFNEMTDIIGCRVVVYLDSEIQMASEALRNVLSIDEKNSSDKRRPDKIDQIGYRSLHLVCTLGRSRSELPEYRGLCEIPIEIQIRTVLQDAWAVIEHKFNYKGKDTLPPELRRKLFLASANLEQIDEVFSEIVSQAESYKERVLDRNGDDQEDLNYLGFTVVVNDFLDNNGFDVSLRGDQSAQSDTVISELKKFGFTGVRDVHERLLTQTNAKVLKLYLGDRTNTSISQIARILLLANDPEKFFADPPERIDKINIKGLENLGKALGRDLTSLAKASRLQITED